jgi:hypothetical protein
MSPELHLGARHAHIRSRDERHLLPATISSLSLRKNEHKDDLAVLLHRYFVFGGSHDWYWLHVPPAKRARPARQFAHRDDLIKSPQ